VSQTTASLILAVGMFGLAVYLLFAPPPGFEDNLLHRIALPFTLMAVALGVLENLRTRTHLAQLVGALRTLVGRSGAQPTPQVKAEAVEILLKSLRSEQESVRRTAARQLQNLTGQDFGEDFRSWEGWWEENRAGFREGKG